MSVSRAQAKRIQESRKRVSRKTKEFLLKPVTPTKRQEVRYRKFLGEAVDKTKDAVLQLYNSANQPQDIDDAMDDLFDNMEWWEDLKTNVGGQVSDLDNVHQQAYYDTITTSVGINVAGFVSEQGLGDLLDAIIDANVTEITDLEESSQKRVADLVKNAIMGQEELSPTLEKQIRESFDKTTMNQAKFIARDQTQRAVNSLNQFRQKHSGIKKYKWSTSRDQAVRPDHAQMQGLEVEWETGIIQKTILSVKRNLAGKNVKTVANGHVGQDYNCRCTASPILEV